MIETYQPPIPVEDYPEEFVRVRIPNWLLGPPWVMRDTLPNGIVLDYPVLGALLVDVRDWLKWGCGSRWADITGLPHVEPYIVFFYEDEAKSFHEKWIAPYV